MKRLFTAVCIAVYAMFFLESCATVEAGGGKSTMVGEDSWTDPVGLQVSIQAKVVEINTMSSFKAGIGFSYQGANYEETLVSGVVRTSYLNIPLLYSYRNTPGFYAEAGLQPAILLSAKDKYNGNSYDYKDAMKTFELGLPVGAGYVLNNGLGIGVRVVPGITKNHKDGNSRNLLILGMLSYEINKPKK